MKLTLDQWIGLLLLTGALALSVIDHVRGLQILLG